MKPIWIHPFSLGLGLLLAAGAFVAMGMQSVQQFPMRRVATFSPPYPPEALELIPVERHAQHATPVQLEQGERLLVIGWNGEQTYPVMLFPWPLVQQPTSDNWIPDPLRKLSPVGAPFEVLVLDGPSSFVFAEGTSAGLPNPSPATRGHLLAYRVRAGG